MPLTGDIVIYGGSFNPPHMGHATTCMWLTHALNAKHVEMVPTFDHPFKDDLALFWRRIEMCRLFAKHLYRVSVSDVEKNLPTPSRMINTLERYGFCSNIAIAIGDDLIDEVKSWERWDEIENKIRIVVVGRTGSQNIPPGWIHYPIELCGTSGTIIRQRISDGKDITGFVSKNVREYIKKHNLYR